MRIALLLIAKAVVGIALLAFILSRVPLRDAAAAIAHLAPAPVAAAIGLYLAAHVVNAFKFRVFLPALSVGQALRFTFMALFYGTALPGQLAGDAVKAVRVIRALGGGNVGEVATAVALDKIVGLFALLVLTALGLGLEAKLLGADAARLVTAIVIVATAGLTALVFLPLPHWLGRWGQAFRLWRETHVSAPVLTSALVLGVLFNLLSIAVFVVLGAALGLKLSLAAWCVLVGLISLALLLPITIAGIGLREASLVGLLTSVGQDADQALALSLSLLVLTLLGALLGLIAELLGRDR